MKTTTATEKKLDVQLNREQGFYEILDFTNPDEFVLVDYGYLTRGEAQAAAEQLAPGWFQRRKAGV